MYSLIQSIKLKSVTKYTHLVRRSYNTPGQNWLQAIFGNHKFTIRNFRTSESKRH